VKSQPTHKPQGFIPLLPSMKVAVTLLTAVCSLLIPVHQVMGQLFESQRSSPILCDCDNNSGRPVALAQSQVRNSINFGDDTRILYNIPKEYSIDPDYIKYYKAYQAMLKAHGCQASDQISKRRSITVLTKIDDRNLRVVFHNLTNPIVGGPRIIRFCGCLQHPPLVTTRNVPDNRLPMCRMHTWACQRTSDCKPGMFCNYEDMGVLASRHGICENTRISNRCQSNDQCVLDQTCSGGRCVPTASLSTTRAPSATTATQAPSATKAATPPMATSSHAMPAAQQNAAGSSLKGTTFHQNAAPHQNVASSRANAAASPPRAASPPGTGASQKAATSSKNKQAQKLATSRKLKQGATV
jgi:hypothetical protein